MAARIPAEERLTNLVVALMATEIGLTKQQILDNVSGYRQRADAGVRSDALEKMFERDKDELRTLGVPVETIGDQADPNDPPRSPVSHSAGGIRPAQRHRIHRC